MRNKYILLTALFFITASAGHAGGNVKDTAVPTINEFILPNGIKVIHQEINENPIASIEVFLKGGIINESQKQAGIANLTQTLMTQGTKTRNSETLAVELENLGTGLSGDVSYDYTSLGLTMLDENLEKSAELLSDVISNPAFDQKEFDKEKANTLAGIKSRKDSISLTAGDAFNSAFFAGHPYSWPECGNERSVASLKREDLVKWHKDFYTANNMFIVIVGKVTPEKARLIAEKYFIHIPSGTIMPMPAKPKAPETKMVIERSAKFQQAFLMEGFPAPAIAKDDYYKLKVLSGLLGGRMTGRLFIELREKLSLAYEVSSYFPSKKEASKFIIYLGLDKKNIPLAQKRISEIIADVKNTPVPAQELTDTKNYLKGIYLLDRQTVGRKSWWLGWWETMGFGYRYDKEYLDKLMAVTPEDIQKAAQKCFNSNMVTIQIVPGKPSAHKHKKS